MHLAAKALTPYNFKLSCPHRLAQLVPSFHLPTTLSRSQHLTQLPVNRKAIPKQTQNTCRANTKQTWSNQRKHGEFETKPCNHSAKSKASAEQREQAQNKRWANAEQAQSKHGASVEQGKSSLLQALSSAKPKVSNILATCCLCENAAEPPPSPQALGS